MKGFYKLMSESIILLYYASNTAILEFCTNQRLDLNFHLCQIFFSSIKTAILSMKINPEKDKYLKFYVQITYWEGNDTI